MMLNFPEAGFEVTYLNYQAILAYNRASGKFSSWFADEQGKLCTPLPTEMKLQ